MSALLLPAASGWLTVKGLKNFFKKHPLRGQSLNVDNSQAYSGDYGDLRSADPYASYSYQMGPWESFLRSFGFRTKYDQFAESMNLQSQEYQAGISEKEYNEVYDSPAAQAQRMREAGQNPDLVGTSGVEASSPLRDDGNPLGSIPDADLASSPQMFADFVLSGVSAAVGLASNLQNLKSLKLANEGAEISNSGNIVELALDTLGNFLPVPQDLDYNPNAFSDAMYSSYEYIRDKYKGSMSRKSYKKFMKAVDGLWSSAPREASAYKEWSERISNRKQFFRDSSSSLYSEFDDVLLDISKELNSFSDQAYKIMSENQVFESELRSVQVRNQMEYEQGINPEADAALHNQSTALGSQNAQIEKAMNDSLRRIVTTLEKKANSGERGSDMAAAALLVFSVLRTMSFSQTSKSGYDKKGNPTSSQSTSVGF